MNSLDATAREAGLDAPFAAVLDRYYDSLANGEWQDLQAQFWCDADVTTVRPRSPGGPDDVVAVDIAAYASDATRAIQRSEPLEIVREDARFDVAGDLAHVIVTYRATDRAGDTPQQWSGVDLFTLVRHAGEWRIAALVCGRSAGQR